MRVPERTCESTPYKPSPGCHTRANRSSGSAWKAHVKTLEGHQGDDKSNTFGAFLIAMLSVFWGFRLFGYRALGLLVIGDARDIFWTRYM